VLGELLLLPLLPQPAASARTSPAASASPPRRGLRLMSAS
jgi:hypothetical protein